MVRQVLYREDRLLIVHRHLHQFHHVLLTAKRTELVFQTKQFREIHLKYVQCYHQYQTMLFFFLNVQQQNHLDHFHRHHRMKVSMIRSFLRC